MTNLELGNLLRSKAAAERKMTAEVIQLIAQAIRQELWRSSEHADIYSWLTKECRYSNGAACRRIQAARFLLGAPEALQKVETGAVTLTALSHAQSALRQEEKRTGQKVQRETKLQLLEQLAGQSEHEAKQTIARAFPEARPAPRESFCAHGDGSWSLTIRLTDEQKRRLERLREATSHSHAEATWGDLVDASCTEMLARVDPIARHERRIAKCKEQEERRGRAERTDQADQSEPSRPASADGSTASQSVTGPEVNWRAVQDAAIAAQGGRCEYVDPGSGKRCGSRVRVQIDHVYPKSIGGEDRASNLRCLCASHNRLMAEELLGICTETFARRRRIDHSGDWQRL